MRKLQTSLQRNEAVMLPRGQLFPLVVHVHCCHPGTTTLDLRSELEQVRLSKL